jgi:hypothetical protein
MVRFRLLMRWDELDGGRPGRPGQGMGIWHVGVLGLKVLVPCDVCFS